MSLRQQIPSISDFQGSEVRLDRERRILTEGWWGRDDPIAGGERAGDGGADGVHLGDALVPRDGGGEGRPDGVNALDAVDVGGVDGRGQHLHADVALPELNRRHVSHPCPDCGVNLED